MLSTSQHQCDDSSERKRVLIATDLLYWRASTGAQQRVSSLVRFLQSEGMIVKTFCLAPHSMSTFGLEAEDRAMIEKRGLDVEIRSSSQIPKRLLPKLRWYLSATKNQIFTATAAVEESPPPEQPATSLGDYRWPWAIEAFKEVFGSFRPEAIIVEYIKLGYLLGGLSRAQRSSVLCLVDTHDVLHVRNEVFKHRGQTHWLDIDREQEAKAISKFDVAIAIQSEEAELFRQMAPGVQVITCGHSTSTVRQDRVKVEFDSHSLVEQEARPELPTRLRIGFLASRNAANLDALEGLLETLWPLASERFANALQLVVAGSICDAIEAPSRSRFQSSMRVLGHVADLATFYDSVDLVVNPVNYGTGLKIKNVEALSFGKPVLTTSHGALGMPGELLSSDRERELTPVQIFSTPETFVELVGAFFDPNVLDDACRKAAVLERTILSEKSIYSELAKVLSKIG